jgi:hypothetical protein
MEDILELRELYGDIFVSHLQDGQNIPWRQLSLQEYLNYDKLLRLGAYPSAYLENEIFSKCVLNKVLVNNINRLRAGIVTSVAMDIMVYSGPRTLDELTEHLDIYRSEAHQVMNQLIGVVCQAFPAYKPEDIYAMNYSTFGLRVAQAEDKLLRQGFLAEPLSFSMPGVKNKPVKELKRPSNIEEVREQQKENLREKWKAEKAKLVTNAPPAPPPSAEKVIITKADIMEHRAVASGHEKDIVFQKQSTDETAKIYENYIKDLKDGKQIRILTDEERIVEAHKRMQANKEKLQTQKQVILKNAAEERKELLKVRERERQRRRKRGGK